MRTTNTLPLSLSIGRTERSVAPAHEILRVPAGHTRYTFECCNGENFDGHG